MAQYAFHDLTLEVKQEGESGEDLARLLGELFWVDIPNEARQPTLRLSISLHNNGLRIPLSAHEVFRADGFSAFESGDDFYLTDGSSAFHLQSVEGQGTAFLAPSFFSKPPLLQSNFWAFCLLKLLRPLGFYSLHAAGVVTKRGSGVLIIGKSGSGKSTLAIGLIRLGWGYLSDDAVLLRSQDQGVEALALRKHIYIDADAAVSFDELPLGEEVPDTTGRPRRRVRLEEGYATQHAAGCFPQVLLFSRVVPHEQSTLLPLDRLDALRRLLAGSGPQLFDKGTMGRHLEILKRLVQQSPAYELRAGLDLSRDPGILTRLLKETEGAERWLGL